MRRWLALVLLVLLPLQATWAAAARYCAHEIGPGPAHVGHHEHAPHGHAAADMADGSLAGDATQPGGESDCSHCHGTVAGLVGHAATPGAPEAGSAPAGLPTRPRAGTLPAAPERPQWARLA